MDVDDRRSSRSDPLDQRLDRWVSAGRQFVDGVSGTRPGTRSAGGRERADRQGNLRNGLNGLGRWVEHRLDQFLEEDDWREPWQDERRAPAPVGTAGTGGAAAGRRRPLEAISRRGGRGGTPSRSTPAPSREPAAPEAWPDEEAFTVPRWRRPELSVPETPPASRGAVERGPGQPSGRPLPRSSRRRPGGDGLSGTGLA